MGHPFDKASAARKCCSTGEGVAATLGEAAGLDMCSKTGLQRSRQGLPWLLKQAEQLFTWMRRAS